MLNESIHTSELVDGIKGEVTVELFDAKSGELVTRQHKHNFIANSGREYLQYLQRVNFKSQISTLSGAAADEDAQLPECFNAIVLTDSADTPNPGSEWSVPGKLIGWADKGVYSGSDMLRGSPNATLSSTSNIATKWVYDWPVHAANGVINSVCWTNNRGGSGSATPSSTLMSENVFIGMGPCHPPHIINT